MAMLDRETMENATYTDNVGRESPRLNEILLQAPVAVAYLSGEEHRFTYVNDLYVQATGRSRASDLLGSTISEALPELSGSGVFELLDEVYRSGVAYRGNDFKVALYRASKGVREDRYFDFTYQPIAGSGGKVEGIFVLAVDLTERALSRRALEQSEERFRLAQEAAQIGTWEWDPVENTRALSPEMHRMYGTNPGGTDAEIHRVWSSRVFAADWPHVQLQMAECQRTGVLDLEYRYDHPEQGLRYHHTKGRRMVGSSRFFGVVGDVTNRKRAEEALRRREEEFRSLADAMPQLVWMADPNGYVHWFNQRWYDYTGTTSEQSCGWGWQCVHDLQHLDEVLTLWRASLASG